MTRFLFKPIKTARRVSTKLDYDCDYSFLNQFFRDGIVYAATDEKFTDMFVRYLDLSDEEIAHLNPATYLNDRVQGGLLNLLSLVGEVSGDMNTTNEYKSFVNDYNEAISALLNVVHSKGYAEEEDLATACSIFSDIFRKVREAVLSALAVGDASTSSHKFLSKMCIK